MINEKMIENVISLLKLRNSEVDFRRIPLDAENNMLEQIRQGRYEDIHIAPFPQIKDNIGLMAKDTLTGFAYLVVSAVAVYSRTAIDAGAVPDDVFDLSDALLFTISYCKNEEELHQTYQTAAVMFAKLVRRKKDQKRSYQLERVLNYIGCNIFRKITLEEVAQFVGLSQNYLCNLFSREMGISLHNYIQKEKVTRACNLLKFSDRTVSDIAAYMGFQTQSNFSSVFRKWTGMTPSEYREKNYQEVF